MSEPKIDSNMIREGLKNGEFFLNYQPIVTLADGRCVGGEALIRWMHTSGQLMPAHFIGLIENTPLSGLLTYWVIDTVAEELHAWLRQHNGGYLSINVPPEILGRGGLEYAASQSGLIDVADKIVLEITERGVPDKIGIDALNELAAVNTKVRVALDDVHLDGANTMIFTRAHVDMIKIEASSVAQSSRLTDLDLQRLGSLVSLMRAANFDIVVEGIESAYQAEVFQGLGFLFGQGFYFSPALPADRFEEYYRTHQ